MTPRSIMGSNNVNNTLREISSIHCIWHKGPWDSWYSQEIEPRRLDLLCKTLVRRITYLTRRK
jgi:hypothetical protein